MEYRDQVLQIARLRPVVPSDVARHLGVTSIIAAAMLSEMVSKKQLKASHLKVGSSPLYYVPGTEAMLEGFKESLGEKELRAFELLKEKSLLREKEISPVVRVCLQHLRDFAIPLEVTTKDSKELFYKWYALPDSQAHERIATLLSDVDSAVDSKNEQKTEPVEEPKERQAPLPLPREIPRQEVMKSDVKEQRLLPMENTSDPFVKDVLAHFKQKNIRVRSWALRRKNAEAVFELVISSSVGDLTYFCVAKNKKKVLESDLSSAFVQGQLEKLPLLFLSRGELTKRGKELLKSLKGITVSSF